MTEGVEDRVKFILSDKLDLVAEEIRGDAKLVDDLDMDSVTAMEVVFELEGNFGINIEREKLKNFITVQDIVAFLENAVRSKNAIEE